jgi:phage baseplate assembly protein W
VAPTTDGQKKEFLGIGWNFPLKLVGDGSINMVAYEDDIRQAIRIVLGTSPGERVMRPDFGAGLNDFIFEPINTTTLALIEQRVETALITWEPRIDLQSVSVKPDTQEHGKLLVNIEYRVRTTNTFYNLVYPFYLAEGQQNA